MEVKNDFGSGKAGFASRIRSCISLGIGSSPAPGFVLKTRLSSSGSCCHWAGVREARRSSVALPMGEAAW